MNVSLRRATPDDAPMLWNLQRKSFRATYERYRDDQTSPYTEPLEKTRARTVQPNAVYYVIEVDAEPVGALYVRDRGDGSVKKLGPLYVLPEHWGQGIAQCAIRLAEDIHGGQGWLLDTIEQEPANCHLYEKMGYRRTGGCCVVNERMTLVDYRK